jgi:hypothetical protein
MALAGSGSTATRRPVSASVMIMCVAVPAAQGEFVRTDHPWDRLLRQRQASQMAQCGTAGDGHGRQTSEACGRPAG